MSLCLIEIILTIMDIYPTDLCYLFIVFIRHTSSEYIIEIGYRAKIYFCNKCIRASFWSLVCT